MEYAVQRLFYHNQEVILLVIFLISIKNNNSVAFINLQTHYYVT